MLPSTEMLPLFSRRLLASARGAASSPRTDVSRVANTIEELGLLSRLQRKPWLLLEDGRRQLEDALELHIDAMLLTLQQWATQSMRMPVAVGLASESRNVYFGPRTVLGELHLEPTQSLMANLFSHGEIGLDAIVPAGAMGETEMHLLREVATFSRMRVIQSETESSEPASKVFKPDSPLVRKKRLAAYPLAESVWGSGPVGTCLRHSNFVHLDLTGNTLDELQRSLARNSAKRAYHPVSSDPTDPRLAGCAIQMSGSGMLYAGSAVNTLSGVGTVSPLQTACVSVLANNARFFDISSVVWSCSRETPEVETARAHDRHLLQSVAPRATFLTDHSE